MSAHHHYDLADMEARIRASIATQRVEDDRAIAAGRAEAGFITAQRAFEETMLQFTLATARCDNEGVDGHLLAAAGVSLGNMAASALMPYEPAAVAKLMTWFTRALNDGLARRPSGETGSVAEVIVEPVKGGHA